MDGQSLSRLMHKRGINLRYLGKLAELARLKTSRLDALAALATQEMISRAFKHVSNRYMQDLPAVFATSCYAHLLNCLLGMEYNKTPKPVVDVEMRSLYSDANLTYEKLDPKTLQDEIRDEVFTRYRFELEDAWVSKMKSLQMLREVSIKLGLQLTAKDYSFVAKSETVPQTTLATNSNGAVNGNSGSANNSKKNKKKAADSESMKQSTESPVQASPTTFEPDDIVNLAPVVKDSSPRSMLAEEALEAGRISLAQDQKELGQELLLESLSLHEQIYGILHPEVARVYYQLSMLYYSLGIKDAAAELARKAVILSERTLGLDHNETVLSYLNLGLFEHANGNTEPALLYIRHALELWKLIYGIKHPDSITTMNNAAVMLQALKQYHASRIWFEKSLTISEEVSGKDSVNTATLSFQLAQALALDQDAKAAVNRMREAYSIFHAKLGPDDRNTKESESWLEQLTQNAVSIAKHAKDVQARRLRRVQMTPRVTLGTQPQPQAGQSSSDMSGVNAGRDRGASIGVDARNVDELIKFIEGGGDSTKSTPKKRSHNHPNKRRGGSAQGGK
jgi:protein TIF31